MPTALTEKDGDSPANWAEASGSHVARSGERSRAKSAREAPGAEKSMTTALGVPVTAVMIGVGGGSGSKAMEKVASEPVVALEVPPGAKTLRSWLPELSM